MKLFEDAFIRQAILSILSFALVFLLTIIYIRLRYVSGRKWKASVRDLYQTLLAQYVNASSLEESNKVKNRIIKLSNNNPKKEILLQELMSLVDNFKGTVVEKAQELYKALDLHKLSLKKLENQRWYVKIDGITQLSLMGYQDCFQQLTALLEYPEPNVRRHAKIAIVELHKVKGLKEVSKLASPLSEWSFISMLSILHKHPLKIRKKDMEELATVENENIVRLAQKLQEHNLTYI